MLTSPPLLSVTLKIEYILMGALQHKWVRFSEQAGCGLRGLPWDLVPVLGLVEGWVMERTGISLYSLCGRQRHKDFMQVEEEEEEELLRTADLGGLGGLPYFTLPDVLVLYPRALLLPQDNILLGLGDFQL